MKRFYELSEEEILALEYDALEKYVKRECAEEGVKFSEEPKMGELPKKPSSNFENVFCVIGFHDLYFKDKEEAESTAALLNSLESRVKVDYYQYEEKYYTEHDHKRYSVGDVSVTTREEAIELQNYKKEKERVEKEFREVHDRWCEEMEKYESIKKPIIDRWEEIQNKHNTMNNHLYRVKHEYLELANNDLDIALNFLKKAYSIDVETETYIRENI